MAPSRGRCKKVFGPAIAAWLLTCVIAAEAERLTLPAEPIAPKSKQECHRLRQEYNAMRLELSRQEGACSTSAVKNGWNLGRNVGEGGCATFYVEPCYPIVQQCDQVQANGNAAFERCMAKAEANEAQQKQAEADFKRRESMQRESLERLRTQQDSLDRQRKQNELDQRAAAAAAQRALDAAQQQERDASRQLRNDLTQSLIGAVIGSFRDSSNARAQREAEENRIRERNAEQTAREEVERKEAQRGATERLAAQRKEALRREEEKKVEAKQSEESNWQTMVRKVQEGKDTYAVMKALVENPFKAVLDLASDKGARKVTNSAIDSVHIGPEANNPSYDTTAIVVDEARQVALSGNPFAERASSIAMEDVNRVNRQVQGALDQVAKDYAAVGMDSPVTSTSSGTRLQVTPLPVGGAREPAATAPVGRDSVNPFASRRPAPPETESVQIAIADANSARSRATPADTSVDSPALVRSTSSPTSSGAQAVVHYDPASKEYYTIPPGYTLYRNTSNRRLTVVPMESVAASNGDGDNGCSGNGLGAVTPACEAQRQKAKNPFAKQ